MSGYQTYVSSILCLPFITLLLLSVSWLCAPGGHSACSLLLDWVVVFFCFLFFAFFWTCQALSLLILAASKSFPDPGVGQKWWFWMTFPLLGLKGPNRWACLSSPPLPSPPLVPHSRFLQEDALPSWSRQAQLCFGSTVTHTHWLERGRVYHFSWRLSV